MKLIKLGHKTTLNTLPLAALMPILLFSHTALAAQGSGFIPGNIIDDATFTNKSSMTADQVQAFLNTKVPACDTSGAQQSEMNNSGVPDYNSNGSIQRWEWGKYKYNQTTFPCLRDYVENGYSAAQIIHGAAQQYNINPQAIIVLLQKEQGLVTDTWPLAAQYKTATGYGCPDTAPCDSEYFGLTNQVFKAANMFYQIMVANPNWYTPYVVGDNSIPWSPKSECGSSNVYIENRATQALYNYTPYRPNQAALDAGYGNGDSCSAYGNRNFYLYFSDWFGQTHAGSLVRTASNPQVYIVSGNNKYPINNQTNYNLYAKLGPLWYATDAYISSLATGANASSLIQADGSPTLYLLSADSKLPFSSCTLAVHYATPCGSQIKLTKNQIDKFESGPNVTQFYETTSGVKYYIVDGKKREIFDDQSVHVAGLTANYIKLPESGIERLSVDVPLIRDNVIITDRSEGRMYFYQKNTITYIPTVDILNLAAFSSLPRGSLTSNSLALYSANESMKGFVQDASGNRYILDDTGKKLLTSPDDWTGTYITLDSTFLSSIPNSTQPYNDRFVKSSTNNLIYYIYGAKKYAVPTWNDLVNLHLDKSGTFATMFNPTLNSISGGTRIYAPGSLLKSSTSNTVYVINGQLKKVTLGSFAISNDMGLSGVRTVSTADLDTNLTEGGIVNNLVSCNGKKFLANKGLLYEVDATAVTRFGYSQAAGSVWDALGCTNLKFSQSPLSNYLFMKKDGLNTIYYLDSGKKRPVGSMSKFTSLGGSSSNLLSVSSNVLNTVSTGLPI